MQRNLEWPPKFRLGLLVRHWFHIIRFWEQKNQVFEKDNEFRAWLVEFEVPWNIHVGLSSWMSGYAAQKRCLGWKQIWKRSAINSNKVYEKIILTRLLKKSDKGPRWKPRLHHYSEVSNRTWGRRTMKTEMGRKGSDEVLNYWMNEELLEDWKVTGTGWNEHPGDMLF